jgi:hypothetical protein
MCWLKIHRDLKLLSLFKGFIMKTISKFLLFLKGSLWEKSRIKILFAVLIQTYASFACKGWFYKICFIQYRLIFQTIIECVSQLLFYKLLFYYFRKNWFQTLFLLFYASKSSLLIKEVLFKIAFCSWKLVSYWFRTLLWIYKISEYGLTWFEAFFCKRNWNKSEKQKKKMKRNKKSKKAVGPNPAWARKRL